MTEMTRSSSVRCGNGDEGFRSLETESFFDGSSQFRPEIAAGGLEAILNKMVGKFHKSFAKLFY